MRAKERTQPGSYQAFVTQQINRLREMDCNKPNPVSRGVFTLVEEFGEAPIWALAFAEKPAQAEAKNIYERRVDNEEQLIALRVPRQYAAIDIEREIILDMFDDQALVERLYGVEKGFAERELTSVATLVKRGWRHVWLDEWLVTVQSLNDPVREGIVTSKKLTILLRKPLPIVSDVRLRDSY